MYLIDQSTFHHWTITLIKGILQREDDQQLRELVLDEAMNMSTLQEGGTFQNALVRKFDGLVIPIFAKIIAFVDRYCNLKILSSTKESEVTQLWLNIYRSCSVSQLIMSHLAQAEGHHSALLIAAQSFECKFPFSWIVNDIMNESNTKGMNYSSVHLHSL